MERMLGTMKQKLYVLLGDVVHSRRISDRDDFQNKVEEACNKINTAYAEDLCGFQDFKRGREDCVVMIVRIDSQRIWL
jgi:hypothetical protein